MQKHLNYYIVESFILGIGFFGVYMLSGSIDTQATLLAFLILVYVIMGVVHHRLNHDIHAKIVLEYIVIGTLVFSIFLLLKSGVI